MKQFIAYLTRDGQHYFVARGPTSVIMGMVGRKVADLELPANIAQDIEYSEGIMIPDDWKYIEEFH